MNTWYSSIRDGLGRVVVRVLVLGLGALPVADASVAHAAPPPPHRRPQRPPKKPPVATKPDPKAEAPAEAAPEPTLQRSNRMDLDARLVRGEAARSGAVYLFQRAPRRLPPLVALRQSYLDEIVVPLLGHPEAAAEAPAPTPPPVPATPTTPVKGGGR